MHLTAHTNTLMDTGYNRILSSNDIPKYDMRE